MAVITGGWSRERERSWLSGSTVAGALDGMGVKAHVLDLADSRDTLLEGLADASKAFLAIAGRGAEDGRLQGVLETLGVPYTGSGVLASAVGMHKLHAKTLVSAAGVRVPASVKIAPDANVEEEAARAKKALGIPLIVKPVSEGGSIGLYVATTDDFALPSAISCAKEEEWMAEAFHAGRSVSVGVLEDEQGNAHVLPPLEAQTPNGIYSYAAKRGTAVCDYHCPARVAPRPWTTLSARRWPRTVPCTATRTRGTTSSWARTAGPGGWRSTRCPACRRPGTWPAWRLPPASPTSCC